MRDNVFEKIVENSKSKLEKLAGENNWLWFYKMHQLEMVKCAKELLNLYTEADGKIVIISCWLHDIAYYYHRLGEEHSKIKSVHHIKSAELAEDLLKNYEVSGKEIELIKNCILKHRDKKEYSPESLEEKIVAVADTLSHFENVFYFTYFKFHPDRSLENMVKK